jgi:hypothetical protein
VSRQAVQAWKARHLPLCDACKVFRVPRVGARFCSDTCRRWAADRQKAVSQQLDLLEVHIREMDNVRLHLAAAIERREKGRRRIPESAGR